MNLIYYRCTHCNSKQGGTEFGECAECGYESLIEITKEEFEKDD